MARAGELHLIPDRPGHDIAGRDFRQLMVPLHECLAFDIAQDRAFSAHRFRQQELRSGRHVERGWMELDEFHVFDQRAGPVPHGDAVPCRARRIRSPRIDLAGASRRKHDGFCRNR